jgi:localization factor PodJL
MNGAAVWNVKGVGRDTRAFAEEAARRAGASLGDWLDRVVADKAAEQGVDPADLKRDERLDAIAERISNLARCEEGWGDAPASRRRDSAAAGREASRSSEDLFEAAVAQLEGRAVRGEARAVRALESIAQWMERSQADHSEDRAALRALSDKLAAIERDPLRRSAPAADATDRGPPRPEDAEGELDARMNALARRVDAPPARHREPPRAPERPRLDLKAAAAQIARRRDELDARGKSPDADAPPPPPADAPPAAPAIDALREEMLALGRRIDAMRREAAEANAQPPVDVQSLRAEIAAMSRSLADLAPRNAVVALEGAVRDLGERVAALREAGGREALIRPVETLIGELRDALRAYDPHAAVAALQRDLRALDAKVDAIAGGVISPAAFDRIRAQTEEVRNLLAAAATRSAPIEQLEKRIGDLADRVERLAASPFPQAETARVVAQLAEARAEIERSTPAAALSAIERHLEALAERMDQAARRPQPAPAIDPRAIDDLARRIDAVRASIERQGGAQPDAAKLEAALSDISRKLDRPAAPAAIPAALAQAIHDLGQRIDRRAAGPAFDIAPLEQALRALNDRPVEIDAAPIENMMRELAATLVAATTPDLRRLESLVGELNDKLSRGAPSSGEIEAMIRDLGQRIDARVGPPLDIRPLEEALRALEARFDAGQPTRLDARFVEQAADLIAERVGRNEGARVDADALASQISDIHDRLDALREDSSNATLERKIVELSTELEATRRALQSPPAAAAHDNDQVAGGLADLRNEQANADKRTQARLATLQDILERLDDRLERLEDEVARLDEDAATDSAAAKSAPRVASTPASEIPSAASRDIPDRAPERPAHDDASETPPAANPSQAAAAPPRAALDGADFLLEPGVAFSRPRFQDTGEAPPPRSAINAHIAAARRAAQAAMAETAAKEAKGKASAASGESVAGRLAAASGRVTAFVAARKRPLLLGAALVVAVAAFAAIELRGPRPVPVPTQKSELRAPAPAPAQTPAQRGAVLELPKANAPARAGDAAIDPNPVGSILAPLTPAKTPAPVPAELAASIPAGAPQALRDAAASGDPGAALELALRLLDGRGVAKDARAAAAWLEQAAARDLAPAQYRLGSLYEKGVGVARDPALAVSWYAKAAAAGNARAMHNLAVMKAEGAVDGKPDYAAAAQWFRKAAELGIRDSQFNLGVLYARGMGAPQDYAQSWLWFSLAAQQGDSDAAKKRDEVAAKIDPAALAAATKALAAFKVATPVPAANDAPAPAGGWEAKSGSPQASLTPAAPLQSPCPRPWCA